MLIAMDTSGSARNGSATNTQIYDAEFITRPEVATSSSNICFAAITEPDMHH